MLRVSLLRLGSKGESISCRRTSDASPGVRHLRARPPKGYIIHWTQGRSLQGAAQGVLIVHHDIYSFHWFFENEESRTVSVLFLVRVMAT